MEGVVDDDDGGTGERLWAEKSGCGWSVIATGIRTVSCDQAAGTVPFVVLAKAQTMKQDVRCRADTFGACQSKYTAATKRTSRCQPIISYDSTVGCCCVCTISGSYRRLRDYIPCLSAGSGWRRSISRNPTGCFWAPEERWHNMSFRRWRTWGVHRT